VVVCEDIKIIDYCNEKRNSSLILKYASEWTSLVFVFGLLDAEFIEGSFFLCINYQRSRTQ